ncbi:MAG: sorbosone dehydrogenase family protein [Bauldia sp.]|uniref:PQQ-dependent sugar dehydrogenase n=1 Tax=Bauldia sp. TaxID=2575872 RepID=UPI001DAF25A3|nr:PQQ-dependent sugar dehydrogenase [Bauldia sp.]MCB1496634.1 sorbosone dehydrogenase family protein [Bauldia sp.]
MRRVVHALAIPAMVILWPVAQTVAAEAPGSDDILTGAAAFGDWKESRPGAWRLITPADMPAPYVTKSVNVGPRLVSRPDHPELRTLDGFAAELVATGFSQPRVIRTAPNGDLFIADSAANEIRVLRVPEGAARPVEDSVFASGLDRPYGIAFYPPGPDPEWIYVANTGSVVRFPYTNGDLAAAGEAEVVVPELPTGYHWTRDIAFSPDGGRLFVAVGSVSNVAEGVPAEPPGGLEAFASTHALGAIWGDDADRGAVLAFNPDGSGKELFATGLRNCSGLAIEPATGDPWCVTNERDNLGDDLPPDFATRVRQGHFYGWPWFYIGDNEDPRDHLAGHRPDLAGKVTVPDVLFPAHSAPLGITFYDGDAFPPEFKGDAFVAMHGSGNRSKWTGYKIVRLEFEDGQPTGAYQDFVTGFVESNRRVWGRPVGVAVGKDGSLFFTEDGSGSVWRVSVAATP